MSTEYYILKRKDYDDQKELEYKLREILKNVFSQNRINYHIEEIRENALLGKWFNIATVHAGHKPVWHPNKHIQDYMQFCGLNDWIYIIIDEYGREYTLAEFNDKMFDLSSMAKVDINLTRDNYEIDDYGVVWCDD